MPLPPGPRSTPASPLPDLSLPQASPPPRSGWAPRGRWPHLLPSLDSPELARRCSVNTRRWPATAFAPRHHRCGLQSQTFILKVLEAASPRPGPLHAVPGEPPFPCAHKGPSLRVLAGATLRAEPSLNRDGSLGFAARFALRLREEHADAISGARTTEDIVLRSVNEVGHLLYFAGTNSWLVLRDDAGRTLDELSR